MKRKNIIIVLILFLAIGFAAVTTTLYINGTISFKPDEDDFDVYFSDAKRYVQIKNYVPHHQAPTSADINNSITTDHFMELPVENNQENIMGLNMLTNMLDVRNYNDVTLEQLDSEYIDYGYVDISTDGKTLEFYTGDLGSLGDYSIVDFVITNSSSYYDASVELVCSMENENYEIIEQSEYFDFTVELDQEVIPAQSDGTGGIMVSLKKMTTEEISAYVSCEIEATAVERIEIATEVIEEGVSSTYSLYGYLQDSSSNYLSDQTLVVYSDNPIYTVTDEYGFFFVDGLEKETHTMYVMGEISIDEAKQLSESEISEQAVDKLVFTTSSDIYYYGERLINGMRIYHSVLERTESININFDANGGSMDVSSIQKSIGNKYIDLPIPTHENSELTFKGWYTSKTGGFMITSSNIEMLEDNQTLYALWKPKCEEGQVCVILGDGTTLGDMLLIGTEAFYVLENDGTNIKMMSEFNLYVGREHKGSTWAAYTNPTGIQDSTMLGWTSQGYPYKGVTPFSSDEQKGTNYSDYSGSLVEIYVNNYSDYLADTLGVENAATLISKEELEEIVGNSLSSGNNLSTLGVPSFLYSTSYWTRSAYNTGSVWHVYSNGYFTVDIYAYALDLGIRPIITISANLI